MHTYTLTQLTPFTTADEEWECRLRMVHDAQEFLYASTYFLQYDRFGLSYLDALDKAHARGVDVTLLMDGFGENMIGVLMTAEETQALHNRLDESRRRGVKLIYYRVKTPLQRLLGSGMHTKIQLSEKGGALFGSSNISGTSYAQWHEFTVFLEGNILPRLLQILESFGLTVPKEHYLRLERIKPVEGTGQKIGFLAHNPSQDFHPLNPLFLFRRNSLTDYLLRTFREAKESIYITSFYFKPMPELLNALTDAAARGVDIRIIHSDRFSLGGNIWPWVSSYCLYQDLIRSGIRLYEKTGGEHSKMVIVDNRRALFGSYNLEYAAHDRLAEAMLVSEDKTTVEKLSELFRSFLRSDKLRQIDEQAHLSMPIGLTLAAALMKPFARWI